MAQPFQQDHFEFAQDVRKTCHKINNFLTILQCQHEFLGVLPSKNIEAEIAEVLKELGPLVEGTARDVLSLSENTEKFLKGLSENQ